MAPKKSKTQMSSSQLSQTFQPAPQRSSRGGRKRRGSDASTASERPTSSQSAAPSTAASTPAKRRKRGQAPAVVEPDIVEEDEDELQLQADTRPGASHDPDAEEAAVDSIQVSQSSAKQVHFDGASTQESPDGNTTAAHITPHPRKMGVKRRFTASPGVDVNGAGLDGGSKRIKLTTRSSLPGNPSQDTKSLTYMLEEREFAPLREIIQERMRSLEDKEGAELDDDMLVLDTLHSVMYPQLSAQASADEVEVDAKMTSHAMIEERLSQSQSQQTAWENERKHFHDAILTLSKEASDYKAKLEVLTIEAQALGFQSLSDDVDPQAVIASIRETFNNVRANLLALLPDTVPEDASNEDVLEILIANVREFTHRLQLHDKELQEKRTLIDELSIQVQGLIDHLADAELRKQKLEQRWSELDLSIEDKDRVVEELQEDLQQTQEERDAAEAELEGKKTELQNAQHESAEFAKTVNRLNKVLSDYRNEDIRLQAIITKLEEEHRATVTSMNKEREETVTDLEDRLDEATQLHGTANALSEERQASIVALEIRISDVEAARDSLQEKLLDVKSQRDQEKTDKELAQADLEERNTEAEDLEARVNQLENELAKISTELDTLRQLNETERTQRESAEEDLDDRNAQIGELNQKLQQAGIQANELRSQLFGAQEEKKKQIKLLELALSERDQQYQDDIKSEVTRRETAEDLSQERATYILDLEARIKEIEQRMQTMVAERDENIEALEAEISDKDGEIEVLESELQTANNRYNEQVTESNQIINDLRGGIEALKASIVKHESRIEILQQEATDASSLHDSEMDDRNGRIAELNHSIAEFKQQIEALETTRDGLERRVEQEAEQMLQLQSEKDDEIEDLKQKIIDQHARTLVVEQKAQAAEESWQDVLAAREEEIDRLQSEATTDTETISVLTADIEAIRAKFSQYVTYASNRIEKIQAAFAQAKTVVDDGSYVRSEGERVLEEMEGLASVTEFQVSKTHTSQSYAQSHSSKGASRGKKRVKDSGIGMDEEDAMMAA